ncbi:MAG: DUF423 domain-containing protein [Myxococcota bacterium]
MTETALRRLSGLLGFSAILLGAIGAHAVPLGVMSTSFETATKYQLLHALLLLYLSDKSKIGSLLIISGCVFFCGGIYLKAFTGNPIYTGLAPAGGISFMLAWLSLAFARN